jgi:predicted kinase
LAAPRASDRLDRRLAARRLRARHVRAVGRALAAREGGPGELSCRTVFVGKTHVRFARAAARDPVALAADLRARGAERLAEQLLSAYALAADDYAVFAADALPARARRLVAVGGLVATGKSTVAKHVARRMGAPRVVADRVRGALLAKAAAGSAHELTWQRGFGERVYAGLLERAGRVLASGRSVVIDACFPSEAGRRAAAQLAARHGARFVFVRCDAPEEDVVARLRLRDARDGAAPGSWRRLARRVEERFEPPRPGAFVAIDTSLPRKSWRRRLGLEEERA